MGYCRECRWWQVDEAITDIPAGWRVCQKTESEEDEPIMETRAMALAPHDRNWAILVTAPDFGCLQFEESAVEPPVRGFLSLSDAVEPENRSAEQR